MLVHELMYSRFSSFLIKNGTAMMQLMIEKKKKKEKYMLNVDLRVHF
jgi:hypothetical protein